jgi:predicted RNA-binding Zn ribbon-like protein
VSGFSFTAGSLALCFVDTRSRGAVEQEKLDSVQAFGEWLSASGLLEHAQPSPQDLKAAISLREAIYRVGLQLSRGAEPQIDCVEIINAASRAAPLRPQFTRSGIEHVADEPVAAALSTLAADAISHFAQPERFRECPECRMLFFDSSRPGKRKWCSSDAGCGNRAKVRRHRSRKQQIKAGVPE